MIAEDLAHSVRRHDPDRFLAAVFAPAHLRDPLLLLCAFNHELARAREVASQPLLALIRLQWWREVVDGVRRRHEVASPLGEALDQGLLAAGDLRAMIDAREIECDETIPDLATWQRYIEGTAGGMAVAAGRLLGADAPTLERLRHLGAAYGAAGQLGSIEALARQQRCMLPVDLLATYGLTPEHVLLDPRSAHVLRPELSQLALGLLATGQGPYCRSVMPAALPAVLAQRDIARGNRQRGLGDKLAVVRAVLLRKI